MFNYYKNEQKQIALEKNQANLDSEAKLRRKQREVRKVLSCRYQERMDSELNKLDKEAPEKPVYCQAPPLRGFLQSRGNKSEKERVETVVKEHSWLDTAPSDKQVFRLRPRMKSRELHRPYSTRPKTQCERLNDVIRYQQQLYDTSHAPNDGSKTGYNSFLGKEKDRFQGGKKVHSYYHFKTHFKSIEHYAIVDKSADRISLSRSILERYRLKLPSRN